MSETATAEVQRTFGWKRQLPDFRDRPFQLVGPEATAALPAQLDLRVMCPAIYDQGSLGSCVDNASLFLCEFDWMRQKKANHYLPSRLFAYYNARALEGTTDYDSGSTIRDGIKALVKWGFCPEALWPYDIAKYRQKPPQSVYDASVKEKILDYTYLPQNLTRIQRAIYSKYPVEIGFTVYDSFMSAHVTKTGLVPMPSQHERVVGGHAVAIVGYDNVKQWFIVRNSWGTSWGDKGYCYMPYSYLLDAQLAADFWVIRTVP